LPPVPTFSPAADSDEVNVATGGDEVTDVLPLPPTFVPATNDAAGNEEMNDEEADVLPPPVTAFTSLFPAASSAAGTYVGSSDIGADEVDDLMV
jgi:hypothetical protein